MYFLAVDGGATKTDFILCNETGQLLAQTLSTGCNILQMDDSEFCSVLGDGIKRTCSAGGISPAELEAAALGLPAWGEAPMAEDRIRALLPSLFGSLPIRCVNDAAAAFYGALGGEAGIQIVSGTGSIGYGQDPRGQSARVGGWSGSFCDEGSCHWIGRQLAGYFTRQADGRLPRTPLYQIVREAFSLAEDLHFCYHLNYVFPASRAQMARLQLLCLKAYEEGDPYAAAIYRQAAGELVSLVRALLGRLCFSTGEKIPVSYSGGLFRSGECILAPFREELSTLPVLLTTPIASPAAGAALLAVRIVDSKVEGKSFLSTLQAGLDRLDT